MRVSLGHVSGTGGVYAGFKSNGGLILPCPSVVIQSTFNVFIILICEGPVLVP